MKPEIDCIYVCGNCGHEVIKSDEQCAGCNTKVEWGDVTSKFISKDELREFINAQVAFGNGPYIHYGRLRKEFEL